MKNKRLLLWFLALNSILSANNEIRVNNNNLYDKITKKLDNGKINDNDYKVIEKILKNRNKELIDLYLQNDFIVKPEFLEWQIFASGFYTERNNGDNTYGNAKYSSEEPEGYFNQNGDYIITGSSKRKPYESLQKIKKIDLGMSIPLKNVDLNLKSLNLNAVAPPVVKDINLNIELPTEPSIPSINIPAFTPTAPNVNKPPVFTPPALDDVSIGFGQGSEIGFNVNNEVTSNGDIVSSGITTIGIADNTTAVSGSNFTFNSWNDLHTTSGTISSGTYSTSSGYSHQAFLNALAGSYDVTGNWVLKNLTNAPRAVGGGLTNTVRFISVNHAYGDYDKNTEFNLNGNVDIYGRSDKLSTGRPHMTVGIEFQSYGALPAKAINNGIMTLARDNAKGLLDISGNIAPGENLIGMTGMVENYVDGVNRQPTSNTTVRNGNVWESTMENRGQIIINSTKSIGVDFAEYSYQTPTLPGFYNKISLNLYVVPGDVIINNDNNYGLRVSNIFKTQDAKGNYFDETVIDGGHGTIEVAGKNNVGVSIARIISGSDKVLKYQKSQGVTLDNSGRPNYGTDPANTDDTTPVYGDDLIGNIYNLQVLVNGNENIGFLRKSDYMSGTGYNADTLNRSTHDFILTDSHIKNINFSDTAKNSVLIRTDKYGIDLKKNLNVDGINDIIYDAEPENSKPNNVVLLANETQTGTITSPTTVRNSAVINLGYASAATQNGLIGLMANNGGKLQNNLGAAVNVNSNNSVGLAVMDKSGSITLDSEGINTGNITVSGKSSTGVYNAGIFTMTDGIIDASGDQSVGIFSEKNNHTTNLNGGLIKSSNNAINLFSGDNATININGTSLEVNNNGLLMFTYKDSTTRVSTGHINITGTTNATINSDGTAFYLKGNPSDITNFINNIFTGTGTLNLHMASSDSRLFILDTPDDPIYLSASSGTSVESLIPSAKVKVTGSGYKPYAVFKGELIVDQNVNLDDSTDTYNRLDFMSSKVTVNSGATLTGVNDSQSAIAQKNYISTPTASARDEITVINNGTIEQNGKNTIGIVTDFGVIKNNNSIKGLGDEAIGIYSANGTFTDNSGSIEIGNKGIGIYGGNLISSNPGYGTKEIEIENNGKIFSSGTSTGSIGIYTKNSEPGISNSQSIIRLGINSDINISSAEKGVGIMAVNSSINGNGKVTIGKNGVGFYLKDSSISSNGTEINLNGDNSVGINMEGVNTEVSGNFTFNVGAKDTVLFNFNSPVLTNLYVNYTGLTINSAPDSSYVGANVNNAGFYTNDTLTLNENSMIAVGKNSALYFDSNTNVTASGNNTILGVADGQYGTTPLFASVIPGIITGKELVNRGVITLNNDSVALYAKNNARVFNDGTINLGENSVGIYGNIVNEIENNGTVSIGENSKGIYLQEAELTNSVNSGIIKSTFNSAIGVYSDYTGAGGTLIKSEGSIDLTGENSIGIYTIGSGVQNINNSGFITISSSTDGSNPSIGIYNNNSGNTVRNTGFITLGEKSLGIYNKGGFVNENGTVTIGNNGVGIFTEGGTIHINSMQLNIGNNEGIGVYALNHANVENNSSNINIGNNSYGFILESKSDFINNVPVTLTNNNVLVYGNDAGTIINNIGADINITGSNNIAFYTVEGGNIINNARIQADAQTGNIAVYNKGGNITNTGNIYVGDSQLIYTGGIIDVDETKYSVGLYGEKSEILNSGNIDIGSNAVGIYVKDNSITAKNSGYITAGTPLNPKNGAIGIFAEGGKGIENNQNITLYGDNVIGIAGKNVERIINNAVITVEGKGAIGIYGTLNTVVENNSTINVSGTDSIGIVAQRGKLVNNGTINISSGAVQTKQSNVYPLPEIINAGIINVNGHFDNSGMEISLKPNLDTLIESNIPGVDFTLSSGSISANSITITDTVKILPDFSQGTNAKVYKLTDVFLTGNGSVSSTLGNLPIVSKSLTWEATPNVNAHGNVDIYMQKKDYHDFTDGLWYDDFGQALDKNYTGSTGDAGKIFDKLDLIENERDFRHVMSSMAGNIYSNMNQREEDIARSFENSMDFIEKSADNTKENVKINIIGGKGRNKEDTDGVVGYDYTTTGILALREVERTYKHKFGYSLGYLHTGFEFKDGNESEEWVDTLQLGLHNKYTVNGWNLKNDLTGRVSIHNIDRNIEWEKSGKSEMNGTYESYSITSDNILGKEFKIGNKSNIIPYGAFRAMYVMRPTFSESGLEKLEVEGNDAWSAKPRAGVELNTSIPLGNKGWELKGKLDFAYEYELADLNVREKAKLKNVESNYHKLSKPEDQDGAFRLKASVGVEAAERYGIYVTGEYTTENNDRDDYRAGVTLKAIF